MLKKITLAFSLSFISLLANAEVTLTNTVFEVVTVTNSDGSSQDKWQQPDKLLPGERVGYQIEVTNQGTEAAADIVIANPIPENTVYQAGSAKGLNTLIEFSTDNGKTYAQASALFVEKEGERVLAEASDYSQLRWTLKQPLAAGDAVTVQYIVKIQ